MNREIFIDADSGETRVAVLEDGQLVEIHVERPESQRAAGNIYRAKVENVLPGMQAAFVNIGLEKNAFLYVADAVPAVNFEEIEGEGVPKPRRGLAINKMLRPGQKVVVQVIKDPIGTKGARVSAYVTLPGHYVVLMPNVDYVGVSRRIADAKERQRLRQGVSKVKPRGMGVIVRTAAEDHDIEAIKAELTYLHNSWRKVTSSRAGSAPKLLHRDLGLVGRVVRDLLSESVVRVVVDDVDTHAQIAELIREAAPELQGRLEMYPPGKQDMFTAHGIEAELNRAIQRRVWLKSGGYLVIDETEAFTVFDVNTGRYVGSTSLAMTVFDTNIEAAAEIARQLRLRDIGGIIIIDFIDMDATEHRQKVIHTLEQNLARDRTRSHVLGLTELGLVEMTRKKVRQSLGDMLTKTCPCCEGRGKILSEATMASRVRREIRELLRTSDSEALLVEVHPDVAAVLIGAGGQRLRELERDTGKIIYVRGSEEQTHEGYKFRQFATKDDVQAAALPVRVDDILDLRVEDPHASNSKDGIARVEGFVLDIEGGAEFVGERVKVKVTRVHRTYAEAVIVGEAEPQQLLLDLGAFARNAAAFAAEGVAPQAMAAASSAGAVATAGGVAALADDAAAAGGAVAAGDKGQPEKPARRPRRKTAKAQPATDQVSVPVAAADARSQKGSGAAKSAGVAKADGAPKAKPDSAKTKADSAKSKPASAKIKTDAAKAKPAAGTTKPDASKISPGGAEQSAAAGNVDTQGITGSEDEAKPAVKSKPRRRGGRSRRGKGGAGAEKQDAADSGEDRATAAASTTAVSETAAARAADVSAVALVVMAAGTPLAAQSASGQPSADLAPSVSAVTVPQAADDSHAAQGAEALPGQQPQVRKARRRRGGRSRRGKARPAPDAAAQAANAVAVSEPAESPAGSALVTAVETVVQVALDTVASAIVEAADGDQGQSGSAVQLKPRRSRSSRRRQAARAAKARRAAAHDAADGRTGTDLTQPGHDAADGPVLADATNTEPSSALTVVKNT